MIWTDLGSPLPRKQSQVYRPVEWPIEEVFFLPPPIEGRSLPPVNNVIESRRTRRSFGTVDQQTLSEWLWLVAREMVSGHSDFGFPLTQRPTSSAGAIHPIHLVLSLSDSDGWWLYLPDRHALASLSMEYQTRERIHHEILPVIDIQSGIVIRFIAEPGKTAAKYECADSLVWRDAGVLIGQMAIVAEALNCNFCPLGITGHEWCTNLEQHERLAGVGLAVLGSP
ncbi:dehydrogenase [Kluyvera georgiana]|uniref:dehydrogenase n=1 Tax=Kluyvera georgiana TaxID=73098 RepID=UPI0009424FA2|nr:dehydrogenase [Kluyvera georgiana]